ncbi:MAG: transposase [Solirubrobacteraceae bacterium]
MLVCCVDGLTGFPDAIEAVYPKTWVQTCIVHYAEARVMPRRAAERLLGGGVEVEVLGIIGRLGGGCVLHHRECLRTDAAVHLFVP